MLTYKVTDGDFAGQLELIAGMVRKGLQGGPVVVTLGRENRSKEQNAKFHALIRDIKRQVNFMDLDLSEEDWKRLLLAAWAGQRVVPALDGNGFVALGRQSSSLNKAEASEFVESLYAYGTEHGVKWSDPALAAYQEMTQ